MAKSFGSKPARSPASMGKRSSGGNILSGGAPTSGPNHTRNRTVAPINLGKMSGSATPLPLNAQGSTGSATMVNRGAKAGDKGGVSGKPVPNVSFRPASKT
jgi:hypothetical protein